MSKINAPWSSEQIENLAERQAAETLHPYTCAYHGTAPLVPSFEGWYCSVTGCDYRQDWALEMDVYQHGWWKKE